MRMLTGMNLRMQPLHPNSHPRKTRQNTNPCQRPLLSQWYFCLPAASGGAGRLHHPSGRRGEMLAGRTVVLPLRLLQQGYL
jgi:hypothetical protein